jgi:hypothetical protein
VLGLIDGRLHALVFTPRAGRVHVISLRKANGREIKSYEAHAHYARDSPGRHLCGTAERERCAGECQKERLSMTNGHRGLALVLLLACFATSAQGQEKMTEHTLKLRPGASSPQATLNDMAWLAGRWAGPALGGEAEEIWGPPKAGSMIGMYRLVRDGKPVFYEFQTIAEDSGSLVLRLKHFNPDLTGWEEKERTVDFRLVGISDRIVQFEGMSFHREGDARMTVYLAIEGNGGTVHEEAFSYTRANPDKN